MPRDDSIQATMQLDVRCRNVSRRIETTSRHVSTRRSLLAGALGSAVFAASGLMLESCGVQIGAGGQPVSLAPKRLAPHPLVDVHCHIFNACDLPIEGFAREVILGDIGTFVLSIPDFGILRYLTSILRAPAPTACAEYAEGGPTPPEMNYDAYDPVAQSSVDQRRLADVLWWVYTDHAPPGVQRPGSLNLLIPGFESLVGSSKTQMDDDPGLPILWSLHRSSSRADCLSAAAKIWNIYRSNPDASDICAKLVWMVKFSRSRKELLLELDSLFSAAACVNADEPGCYRIYTPAIVDYDYWLDVAPDENTAPGQCAMPAPARPSFKHSVISEQVMAMSRIAQGQPKGHAVFGFVPFDPFRQAMNVRDNVRGTALDVVKDAIENRGFIGVKLYPPMGFRPMDNEGRVDGLGWDAAEDYFGPQVARRASAGQLRIKFPTIGEFGAALDDALTDLYQYCIRNDVPIMAHCSKSQESFPRAADCANPAHWRALLDKNGDTPQFNGLHVNLGHSGGIWCMGLRQIDEDYHQADVSNDADGKKRSRANYYGLVGECEALDPPRIVRQWTQDVLAMATADFPNLYFDVADWSEIYKNGWGTDAAIDALKCAYSANPEIANRMLYGTDWSMLGQYPGQEKYCDTMYESFVGAMGKDAANAIMGRNALRFLGLVGACAADGSKLPASKQRARLRAFYRGTPKADELEQLFDSMCG